MLQAEGSAPRRIVSLGEEVIQQIAAGEVIQRPVNAIKELLDNALDAGSSQINIAVKEGGKKMLSVQDNGHGIEREDLPLLCKRHATSKLRSFEDLDNLSTLGFRGEALASISTVAHLTVITKAAAAVAGLKICYKNTVLEPPGPLPCAAQNGTTFIVDDLFYSNEQRRKALGSAAEEYARILDLLGRYAISRPDVGFSCKKQGERRPDLHTVAGTSAQDIIRVVYGASIAQSLLPIELEEPGDKTITASADTSFSFTASGFVSCTHYSGRKGIFIIRINGHIVQCRALEHSLEAAYFSYARNKPFIYLDVKLPGDQVDVNVHPTKHEVVFLHQEEILSCISDAVECLLQGPIRCHCMRSIAHSLKQRLQSSVYVGLVDNARLLVQQDTELLLINIGNLGRDLFYQLVLQNWGNLQRLIIDEPVRIADLAVIALQMLQPDLQEEGRWQAAVSIEERLVGQRDFLAQGAAVGIDREAGTLTWLPVVLDNFRPDPTRLPLLVCRLAECSDWENEEEAISCTSQALADFYSPQAISDVLGFQKGDHHPPAPDLNPGVGDVLSALPSRDTADPQSWATEHVLFPAIRSKLIPAARRAKDGSIVRLVSLKTLYKVFERC
ncbi:hypothetical protein WJX75_009823 [Coccomyxa subellipsoidea]|uniref:DNA mismatch repair protein S5 domain-containing protein n=1 Tax=Coccomyxa subellipsoidea TaxID=248742 RepID=A0ABR2YHE2_9CHLO